MRAFGWPVFGSVWGAGGGDGPGPVSPLQSFYDTNTIGIHLRSNGATPPGGPVTAIANEGGAGPAFNAAVVGTAIPLNGNFLEATASTGYPQTANPAELVGVRLMWAMRPAVAASTYRFFGASIADDVTYIRTNSGTQIQLVRTIGGVTTSVTLNGVTASTAARIFEIELGATARLFINGVLVADVANSFTTFRIDRLTQGPTSFQAFEGGMGDVLGVVTGQANTDAAIAAARYYLDQRFALGLGFPAPTPPADVLPNGRMWVGQYDDSSVTVTMSSVDNVDQIRLAAVPVSGGGTVVSDPIAVDPTYDFARATLAGLTADTEYNLQLRSVEGTATGDEGSVRTRPAARQAFKIGFASCYWAGQGNNHPIFDTIIDQNPDMLAFYNMGDRGYADISTNNVALYHAADDTAMSLSRAARLHRSMPNLYMWDDHDYGANDSGASSASRAAAVSWFRSRVPMRPVLTGATDAPYYAHSPMPGVTVAMLDTRSERSAGSAQMIGAGQEAWLIGLIEALPLGDVLVINASVPWVATSAADTWSIASAQRQRIADAVTANCPGQVYIIAGDMHALAYDNGTNSVSGLPVAQAAPLGNSNSTKGGPYSTGPIQATQHQYGTLVFTPTDDGWTVRFEGWSVDDAGVQTRRIDQTATLEPPAVVEPPAGDAPVLVQTALSPQDATGQVTSVTVNYAQPTEGNLLVAMFGGQSTSLVIPDIAGWNVASYHIGTGFRHKAYWKFAGASEPTSVTQEVSSGSPRSLSGQVMEFGNVAAAYNLLVDTDGSLSATTGLDLGPHSALENAISVAFMIYDVAGASETTSTGPGPDFTSTLNARSNANQRFGAKISAAAENVAASFTLAASVRSGRTLITFNPVAP